MYNKPSYLSDKEWLINKLSEKLTNVPRETISVIIQDTFMNLIKQMELHNELEVSGLGKFMFRTSAAKRQLAKYETAMAQGKFSEKMLDGVNYNINYIKAKI